MPIRSRWGGSLFLSAAALFTAALTLTHPSSWSRFCLLVGAGLCLAVSPDALRRAFRDLARASAAHSGATVETLRRRPALYVLYAIWLACLVALPEIGLKAFEDASGKRVLGLQYFWEVPLGYVLPLLVVGILAALLRKLVSPRGALRALVFIATVAAVAGWITVVVRGVHLVAAAAFGAGAGAQLARLAGRHPYAFHTLMRRTLPWLAAAVIGLATGSLMWPRWVEARAEAALPTAPRQAPNVLLLVLDTVRARSLGLYGYERSTSPNLDRFAGTGVVFDRAFSTSPWTLPSHGGMFTGRLPHELTGGWMTPIDGTHPMLAEALSSAGYETAGFVANTAYGGAEFGLARGFVHYEDHPRSVARSLLSTSFGKIVSRALMLSEKHRFGLKSAAQVNADFLRWVDGRDSTRPFFAFVNYYDAHAPYLSPPEYSRRFRQEPPRGDIWSKKLDAWAPDEIPELNTAYDSAIAYLDDQLGRLFAELEGRGLLGNTAVIITADHGEQFGEHGLLEHANSLYLPLLHVPLVIAYPNHVPAGARLETFVSLRDIASTVLDLTGQRAAGSFPGSSLSRLWSVKENPVVGAEAPFLAGVDTAYDAYPNSYPARQGPMRSIFAGTWHYIRNDGSQREELYNLAEDFQELRDRAASDPRLLGEYRTMLERVLRETAPKR